MQLWDPEVFTLDCDFGERLGVAGLWTQRLPPKVPHYEAAAKNLEI